MQKSDQIAELAAALSKCQAEIGKASKDSTNPHFKSKYADLESVWDTAREPMTKHGLAVLQTFTETGGDSVNIVTVLTHTSGQFISGILTIPLVKRDAQGVGSAITYGRRYSLAAILGIVQTDDDGNEAVKPAPKPKSAVAKSPHPETVEEICEFWLSLMGYKTKEHNRARKGKVWAGLRPDQIDDDCWLRLRESLIDEAKEKAIDLPYLN